MYLSKREEGKKLYKVIARYELIVEQEILADNEDQAHNFFLEFGGLNYGRITESLTDESETCETTRIEARTPSTEIEYVGTVKQVEDSEFELEYNA